MTHGSHAPAHSPPLKMGVPIPNGKLGMWLFLGTETTLTMFDTRTEQVALQVKDVGEAVVTGAQRMPLPDGRWHFQHGPIDCVIAAEGAADAVAAGRSAAG